MITYASGHTAAAEGFLVKLESAILFPLMTLLVAVAFLVFLWGGFQYVKGAGNDQERERGSRSMLYGVIGLLIILSAYAILKIAANTFGIEA